MSEPLTWAAICERYPDQWVCLVEIDWTHPRDFEFRTARVIGHGKTRRAPLEQARVWWDRYPSIGFYSTRDIPALDDAPPCCLVRVDIPDGVPLIYPCRERKEETIAPLAQEGSEP
jgi:hypothetical protein